MNKPAAPSKAEVESLKINEKKWSRPLMAAGWSAIPSIIIEKQEALGLDAVDMNIILHLTQYWWQADNLPHPSVGSIAKALGVTARTVQKRISALQNLGFIRRIERRHTASGSLTNQYSFEGLIAKVTPFAEEKLREIARSTEAKKERLARKRPKLVVNNDE